MLSSTPSVCTKRQVDTYIVSEISLIQLSLVPQRTIFQIKMPGAVPREKYPEMDWRAADAYVKAELQKVAKRTPNSRSLIYCAQSSLEIYLDGVNIFCIYPFLKQLDKITNRKETRNFSIFGKVHELTDESLNQTISFHYLAAITKLKTLEILFNDCSLE